MPMKNREIFEAYLDARKGKAVSHCIVYGVFCAALGIEEEETLYHYLYAQTSAMVTNCVKTIPLSQSAGQQLLSGCYPEFAEILEEIRTYSEDDLCLSAPGFDIRGIQHENCIPDCICHSRRKKYVIRENWSCRPGRFRKNSTYRSIIKKNGKRLQHWCHHQ